MASPKGPVKAPSRSGKPGGKRKWLPKHDIFAEALVAGRTIKDALTLAGVTPNSHSISSRWLAWEPMKARLAVLRADRMHRLALNKDQVVLNLIDTYNGALRADQYMAAARCMDQIAKLLDLYPTERQQMEVHLIAKPALEPTKQIELSVEDWKGQFSPKEITRQ
jgi:hypothetical protein